MPISGCFLGLGSGWSVFRLTGSCSRRPLLEPNLNASGLLCLSVGVLGLLLAETVSLPVEDGAARNPAEPSGREDRTLTTPSGKHTATSTKSSKASRFLPRCSNNNRR